MLYYLKTKIICLITYTKQSLIFRQKVRNFFFLTKKKFGVDMTVATDNFIKNFPGLNFFSFNY